ncbi:GNAT family N-acetyltransferase [Flavihumibacter sp.]|uniref:GNAT family N-acetyltransferase n=1 Tax=Flavihumibacter sp. TaxID=1913981 RepID=UPI002FCB098C
MNMMQCSLLLSSNFSEDPLFRYAFTGTPEQRHRGMEAYFGAALDYCLEFGELIMAPGNTALLAWIPGTAFPPHIDDNRISSQPMYVVEAWRKINMHEETPEAIISRDARHFGYIWLLAVDFSVRGRGLASQLLDSCFDQMREAAIQECWLSTENESNAGFYTKKGFVLVVSETAKSGVKTFVFKKELNPPAYLQ